MSTLINKQELRQEAIKKREDMHFKEVTKGISQTIVQKIINSADFKNALNIALYYPVNGEVNLLSLLKIKGKNFFFPKCDNLNLKFVKFENSFEPGKFNIPTPNGEIINPQILDLIYVPALVANANNYRLGYGKGFYDRFFSSNNLKAKKIIVIAKDFIRNDFIQEKFDFKCDEIISA